jgi:hypothetical protein
MRYVPDPPPTVAVGGGGRGCGEDLGNRAVGDCHVLVSTHRRVLDVDDADVVQHQGAIDR